MSSHHCYVRCASLLILLTHRPYTRCLKLTFGVHHYRVSSPTMANISSILHEHLAFQARQAYAIEAAGQVDPKDFGHPFKYIPLKSTAHEAVVAAMYSSKSRAVAAFQETEWYILQISIPSDKVLQLFIERLLRNNAPPGQYRYYGNLQLEEFSHNWTKITIGPIGMEEWAEGALTHRYRLKLFGICVGCGAQSVIWTSSVSDGRQNYCAKCWNNYFQATEIAANDAAQKQCIE